MSDIKKGDVVMFVVDYAPFMEDCIADHGYFGRLGVVEDIEDDRVFVSTRMKNARLWEMFFWRPKHLEVLQHGQDV